MNRDRETETRAGNPVLMYPLTTKHTTSLGSNTRKTLQDEVIRIFREFFLNRLDRFAVNIGKRFDWVIPQSPENLEEFLRAHLSRGESAISYITTPKKNGRKENGRALAKWLVGAPCISVENTSKWSAIDLDGAAPVEGEGHKAPLVDPLKAAIAAYFVALSLGLVAYLEQSKSATGWHLWIFYQEPIPAIDARRLGRFIVASIPEQLRALKEGGGFATGLDAKGIEVFPKNTKLGDDGCGHQVWLPCFGRAAQAGASRFYQVSTDGVGVELDTILNLTKNLPSAVSAALAKAPEDKTPERRSTEAKPAPRTARTEDFIAAGGGWPEWRKKVLLLLNIEDIYRKHLTGKPEEDGALECRDFRVVDEHPSALVATGSGQMERGSFYSYRDSVTLTIFDFLVESGVVSTLNDAFSWVAKDTGIKTPESTPRRYTSQLEAAEARALTAPVALTLDAAHELILAEAEKAFYEGGLKIFAVSIGGGKTTQVCKVIARLVLTLKDKQKIAFHVENHTQASEVYDTLKKLGVSVRRNFSPGAKEGIELIELVNGKLVKKRACGCAVPLNFADELAAGWHSSDICAKCIFNKKELPENERCKVAKGYEGDEHASVIVTTHATPVTDATFFIVDENPELTAENKVSLDDCDSFLKSGTIRESQYKAIAKGVKALWSKVKNNEDLVIENKEEILRNLEYLRTKDNPETKIKEGRPIVRRIVLPSVGDNKRPCENAALKVAHWMLEATVTGNPIYSTTIKGVKSLGFSSITRMGEALKERTSAMILDGTASKESIALLDAISGKTAELIRIAVKDGVQVDRVWLATRAASKSISTANKGTSGVIDKHGRPDWKKIALVVERVTEELLKRPYIKTPLLIWYKQIIDLLREALAAQSVELGRGEGAHNPTKDTKGQIKPNKAQNEALEAFGPLIDLVASRGGVLELLHWGKVRGVNAYQNCDSVLALGALFAPLEELRRTRQTAGLPIGQGELFTAEEFADQLAIAASEIDQGLGRARVTLANNRERVFLLALGPALPPSFKHGEFEFKHYHQGDGRPRREAPPGEDLAAELLEAKEKAGSNYKLAAILGCSEPAVRKYLKAEVVPPTEILEKIRAYNQSTAQIVSTYGSLRREDCEEHAKNSETNGKAEEEVFGVRLPYAPSPAAYQVTTDCAEEDHSPDVGSDSVLVNVKEIQEEEKAREARACVLASCFGVSPWTVLEKALRVPSLASFGDGIADLNLAEEDLTPSLSIEEAEKMAAWLEVYQGASREEAQERTLAVYDQLIAASPLWAKFNARIVELSGTQSSPG